MIDLKRLKRRKTWLRIIGKSGHEYLGQITKIREKYIILEYSRPINFKNKNLKLSIKITEIEAIECLECETGDVFTKI